MSSVEVFPTQMVTSYHYYVTALSIALSIVFFVFNRLSVIRADIRRRRQDIPQGQLKVVFKGEDPKFEIIAVQGLGSDPKSTWKSKDAANKDESDLLEKLLPQRLGNARISKFIYNSDWDRDGSVISPQQLGQDLVRAFKSRSESHPETCPILPIVFLGHSFGGIVIKYALVEAVSREEDLELWNSTRGIIFLGTPHLGSSLSRYATATAYMNRLFGSTMELPVGLQANNSSLSDIKDKFQHQLDRETTRRVRIMAVQEMKQVNLFGVFSLGWVVDRNSATAHAHESFPWACSHTELNKFRDDTDNRFEKLVDYINRLAPSSILEKADETLRKIYLSGKKLDIIRLSGEQLDMENCYINLGHIKMTSPKAGNARPSASQPLQQSLMTRLRLEEPETEERLDLLTLFDPRKPHDEGADDEMAPVKRVLIRGQAGIGKSTLCKKIVHEFYTNKMWRTKFESILWIPLRHIRLLGENNRSLENLLVQELLTQENKELAARMREQLGLDKFNRTLFLLDGLDEVHSSLADDGDGYTPLLDFLIDKPNVIVTSRPHFRVQQRRAHFDMEVEVLGLTSQQIDHYITSSPYGPSGEIRDFLGKNNLIQDLVRIPIQLEALCYTWNQQSSGWKFKEQPRTMTELYQATEINFRRKDLVRRGLLTKPKVDEMSDNEVQSYKRSDINLMESLAFAGLCLREVNFDPNFRDHTLKHFQLEHQLSNKEESVASVLHDLSFLRSSDPVHETQRDVGTYHFLHLTFQEYFAARYFARHWAHETGLIYLSLDHKRHIENKRISAKDFFHEYKYLPSFDVFWRFVSGLLKPTDDTPEDCQNDFFDTLGTLRPDLLGPTHQRLVMHCLMEVRQDMPLRSRLETNISRWLRFELQTFASYRTWTQVTECPDSIVIDIIRDTSFTEHETLFYFLDRPSLSTALLQEIYEFVWYRYNGDGGDIRPVACDILKKHPLPANVKESVLQQAESSDDEIRLAEIKILASHQYLPPNIIERYINHSDPEVRLKVANILTDPSYGLENASKYLTAWRRDTNQEVRLVTVDFLKRLPSIDDKLVGSILVPLPDDDLAVHMATMLLLDAQKALPLNVFQAVFQCSRYWEQLFYRRNDHNESPSGLDWDNIVWLVDSARSRLLSHHQEELGHDITTLLKDSHNPDRKRLLKDLRNLDHISDPIVAVLTHLLEDEDIEVVLAALYVLAIQKHLSNHSLDIIITALQESHMRLTVAVKEDCSRVKMSEQFVQKLESLLINGEAPIRQLVLEIFFAQQRPPLRGIEKLMEVSGNSDTVRGFKSFPRQAEESLAAILGHPDPEIRSKVSCLLKYHGPLRNSTLEIVAGYLEQTHSSEITLAAIEALQGSEELQPDIWRCLEKLLDSNKHTRLPIVDALKNVKLLPSGMLEVLARLFEDEDAAIRSKVRGFFQTYYKGSIPESAIKYVVSRFEANSKNKDVQLLIAETLGAHILASPVAAGFVKRLANNDEDVRLAFIESLYDHTWALKPDFDIILPLLEVSTGSTRERTIEIIQRHDQVPVTDKMAQAIAPLLKSSHRNLRENAGYILARHHSGDYLPEIAKLLRQSDNFWMPSRILKTEAELRSSVISILADLLQDDSVEDDSKEDALKTLVTAKYDRETDASKTLLSKIVPLLENNALCRYALDVLEGYDDLSRQDLGETILKIKKPANQNRLFGLFLSHCGEADISSFINDHTDPFCNLAFRASCEEEVSIYFVGEDTIRVNTPTVRMTITLKDPDTFVRRMKGAREGLVIDH